MNRPAHGASVLLFAVAIVAASVATTEGAGASPGYRCPPYGCARDGDRFDAAGTCPDCGMRLTRESEMRNVAILVFEGVQIIDFTGPYEVFGQVSAFNVYTVSETGETLTTAMGMSLNPSHAFADAPRPDILVVPGGAAHVAYDNEKVIAWVRKTADGAEHVLSVCNGAFILARAGLLVGQEATTFYGLLENLAEFAPATTVVSDRRFVDNGKVITSAGLSSGIDASLHLVSKIQGRARATALALHLEYDWDPDSSFARAALADMRFPRVSPPEGLELTLVATPGDRQHWERRYVVEGEVSVGELSDHVERQMAALASWKRREDGLAWSTVDDDGTTWVTTLEIEGEENASSLTARIRRGA